jgi:hypothetical protein
MVMTKVNVYKELKMPYAGFVYFNEKQPLDHLLSNEYVYTLRKKGHKEGWGYAKCRRVFIGSMGIERKGSINRAEDFVEESGFSTVLEWFNHVRDMGLDPHDMDLYFVWLHNMITDLERIAILDYYENFGIRPFPIQIYRVRKQYFDAIVDGTKTEELRKCSEYWQNRLINTPNPPKIAKFICGRRTHSRLITARYIGLAEEKLGRKLTEQGKKDLEVEKYHGCCVVTGLGSRIII